MTRNVATIGIYSMGVNNYALNLIKNSFQKVGDL